MKKLFKLFFIIHFFVLQIACADDNNLNFKNAIVNIKSHSLVSIYPGSVGQSYGTGFVYNKEKGIIITCAHLFTPGVGEYSITFYNGQEVEAKLIYYDIWQDYAILQVQKKDIPADVQQLKFSTNTAKINDNILIISNSEINGFSIHQGYITSLYEINGLMPQCSYSISVNSAGGASGSPILNNKNEVIGLLYGGGTTYVLALHGQYIKNTLDFLEQGKEPIRKHIGVITNIYSLSNAVKYRNFPKQEMDKFLKEFPHAKNKVIEVSYVIPGTPAENLIHPGDIIWEVNNIPIGGNLFIFDKIMDQSAQDQVSVNVFRNGERIKIRVPLYNINDNKINKIVEFNGAFFFESDDYISTRLGVPLKSVSVLNVISGSSFNNIPFYYRDNYKDLYRFQLQSIDNYKINNLDDLINHIPKKPFTVKFKNYQFYNAPFGGGSISAHANLLSDIDLDQVNATRVFEYDSITHAWKIKYIESSTAPQHRQVKGDIN